MFQKLGEGFCTTYLNQILLIVRSWALLIVQILILLGSVVGASLGSVSVFEVGIGFRFFFAVFRVGSVISIGSLTITMSAFGFFTLLVHRSIESSRQLLSQSLDDAFYVVLTVYHFISL